ncbi:MAG: DUF4136 domain-containing protein [Chitinophagaceae bacterium]
MKQMMSIICGACLFAACSSALEVTSDYDRRTDFSQYRTFAIDTFRQMEHVSKLNSTGIIRAVQSELIQKGYIQNSYAPDMLVHISVILDNRKTAVADSVDYYCYGGYYRPYMWPGGIGATGYITYDIGSYKEGSLIIDIVDADRRCLFWEGIGNKEIDRSTEDADLEIPVDIASILKTFPGTGENVKQVKR